MPWLKTNNRWKFVLGEMLLDRATPDRDQRSVAGHQQPTQPASRRRPRRKAVDLLDDLMSGAGRGQRISAVRVSSWARWLRHRRPCGSRPLTEQHCHRAGSSGRFWWSWRCRSPSKARGEEPVLITKGSCGSQAASRATTPTRGMQTDGRIAVANMIGFGEHSRPAHWG